MFAALVQAIFTRRRKTLVERAAGVPPTAPAADRPRRSDAGRTSTAAGGRRRLTIAELVRLADVFAGCG